VAVAWLLERAARSATALVPIIGPRTIGQLDEYLAARQLTLSPKQYDLLSEVSAAGRGADQASFAFGADESRFRRHPVPVV
jgi:aryl-alcohol dehydrogenase-like predicted oxidoreductase